MSHGKKNAPVGRAPFEERLSLCWRRGDWAAFVTLYLREPRERAEAAPAARFWGAALYNCLTTALFVEKDLLSAKMAAQTILKENVSPVLRDCARTAADFCSMKDEGIGRPLDPLEQDAPLPQPYARLRGELEALLKAWDRKRKSGPAALLGKMTTQYVALPGAKNAARFNTFAKTALELECVTSKLPSANIFRAVAVLAEIIRDVNAREHPLRDPRTLFLDGILGGLPGDADHPVISRMWEYLCRSGGVRYGPAWERQIRALRLMRSPKFCVRLPNTVLRQVFAMMLLFRDRRDLWSLSMSHIAILLGQEESVWRPREAYFLDTIGLMTLTAEEIRRPPWEVIRSVLARVMRNGKKLRPNDPLPKFAREAVIGDLPNLPFEAVRDFVRLGAPVDALPSIAIVFLAGSPDWNPAAMERALAQRLPLRLTEDEKERLCDDLFVDRPTGAGLANIRKLLTESDFVSVTESWLWNAVRRSRKAGEDGTPLLRQEWGHSVLAPELLHRICVLLPPDSPMARLCALCDGVKKFALSSDPGRVDAFFASPSRASESREVDLYLWLLTWPEVDIDFLRRLGERTYPQCAKRKLLKKISEILESIRDEKRKNALVRDIEAMWARRGAEKAAKKAAKPARKNCSGQTRLFEG